MATLLPTLSYRLTPLQDTAGSYEVPWVCRSGIQAQAGLSFGEDTPQGTLCPLLMSIETLYARHSPAVSSLAPALEMEPGCSASKTKRIMALKVRELTTHAEGEGDLSPQSPGCSFFSPLDDGKAKVGQGHSRVLSGSPTVLHDETGASSEVVTLSVSRFC